MDRTAMEAEKSPLNPYVLMVASPRMRVVLRDAEDTLRRVLGEDVAENIFANRIKRDGDSAHVTLLNPVDGRKAVEGFVKNEGITKDVAMQRITEMAEKLRDTWKARGIGKVTSGSKIAYFMVMDWQDAKQFRDAVGVDPDGQDFHMTIGFGPEGDVHGVRKNQPLSENELR